MAEQLSAPVVWEDALIDGLVSVDHVEGSRLAVRVTAKGTEILRS